MFGHSTELGLAEIPQHEGGQRFLVRAVAGAHWIPMVSAELDSSVSYERVGPDDIMVIEALEMEKDPFAPHRSAARPKNARLDSGLTGFGTTMSLLALQHYDAAPEVFRTPRAAGCSRLRHRATG